MCGIYDSRQAQGYTFCIAFDCLGAGQAVTKLFRDMDRTWRTDESIAKIQFDVFVHLYLRLVGQYDPDRPVDVEVDADTAEQLSPFIDEALDLMSGGGKDHG